MSLQPLRISPGRKLAAGLAGIFTMSVTLTAGCLITGLTFVPGGPGEPQSQKLFFIALAVLLAIASVTVCHLLMRAALGRHRTGGSLTRFFRYQLAALGVGGGLGLGFVPAMTEAAPVWWVISIAVGVGLIAVSLLAFRKARYPILDRPPYPSRGLAEGRVVDYWSGSQARAPSLVVVHFINAQGRDRWVRHLVQQSPSMQGTVGQVVYDRSRPERVRRFAVTHQLFDLRPLREIRENPTSRSPQVIPMPPDRHPPWRP
ncbi:MULTISPECIES: hypothetical protein [unclassified Brevibacterium]|uniref:hypothetical protein n=1 Tax=unclassified Brevibacterium TaxID=2614124 RepID=UPI00109192D2|nr:hypothetical protein [Brevibacterium sp. S22]TGD32001.1 hypothetical protein EB835_05795 [Brevibacterium sp. S22]